MMSTTRITIFTISQHLAVEGKVQQNTEADGWSFNQRLWLIKEDPYLQWLCQVVVQLYVYRLIDI
jgi:hypothetical protein